MYLYLANWINQRSKEKNSHKICNENFPWFEFSRLVGNVFINIERWGFKLQGRWRKPLKQATRSLPGRGSGYLVIEDSEKWGIRISSGSDDHI